MQDNVVVQHIERADPEVIKAYLGQAVSLAAEETA